MPGSKAILGPGDGRGIEVDPNAPPKCFFFAQ